MSYQLNVEKYNILEIENKKGLEQVLQLRELQLPVVPKIELERKRIGPKAKQNMGKLVKMFSETEPQKIIDSLKLRGRIVPKNILKD